MVTRILTISISLFVSFNFTLWSAETEKCAIRQVLLFILFTTTRMVVWPRLGDSFVSQNPRKLCAFHSYGRILRCAYTVCLNGQI